MQTVTPTDTQASRPTERQTGGRRDGWVVGRAATHTDREIARQTDRSTGTETDRQTASLTDALSRAVHVPVSLFLVLFSTWGQALAEARKKLKADIFEIKKKANIYEPGALFFEIFACVRHSSSQWTCSGRFRGGPYAGRLLHEAIAALPSGNLDPLQDDWLMFDVVRRNARLYLSITSTFKISHFVLFCLAPRRTAGPFCHALGAAPSLS